MTTFFTLYRYEMKKIFQKWSVRVTLAILAVTVVSSYLLQHIGSYYVDGVRMGTHWDILKTDMEYARALDGRVIDEALLGEMTDAYQSIPETEGHYTLSEEYQKNARPYSEIFYFAVAVMNIEHSLLMSSWKPDLEELYASRRSMMEKSWDGLYLTEREKDYWRSKEDQIEKPVVYRAHMLYEEQFSAFMTVGVLALIAISVCLTGVFSEEHARKTDQLILSSACGRTSLYWAKFFAGGSFAGIVAIGISVVSAVTAFLLYGGGGWDAAFQFVYPYSSLPINCGQAMLIAYGVLLITSMFFSVLIMLISEVSRTSIAGASIGTAMIIVTMMFSSIPDEYRVPAQIWDCLPTNILSVWNLFSERLFPMFGTFLTACQAVPVIYLVMGSILVLGGKAVYKRAQV